MKKKKKKTLKIIFLLFVPIFLVLGSYYYYYNVYLQNNINSIFEILENDNNKKTEENPRLKNLGYNNDEITLINNLDDQNISIIESRDKVEYLNELITDTYFIENKLVDYIEFIDNNKENSIRANVELVNTNRNNDFYTNIEMADEGKGELILTNKYYKLSGNFIPENLVSLNSYHGIGTLSKVAHDAFLEMHSAASDSGLRLYSTSNYRDYDHQKRLYTNYAANSGQAKADRFSARPGHSEHQTGLALDFIEPGSTLDNFDNTNEFVWLQSNAHNYGFILRYPKDKENITGYMYEPWHYRYVGKEVATYIHETKITFDEYFEYYVK